jgi:GrpB-like predicted nucleotidyltransferase (UPF0157 family)
VPRLERAGYTLRIREPDRHEHRLFNGPAIAVNVHVFTEGDTEIERMLTFRDRLRGNHDDRNRYATAKRTLAARRWRRVQDYADAKSDAVEEILLHARA